MAAVVHQGLARLPDSDIQALATYFSDLGGAAGREPQAAAALALAQTRRLADVGQETDPAANLYLAGCAYCHYSAAPGPGKVSGSLALSTALTADDPANFIQTVLHGVGGAGTPGPYMPAFAGALTDADIALLAAYLRRTRSDRPAWPNLLPTVTAHRPMAAVPP